MNNIDKARLLIRVANALPDGADRSAVLAWADKLLAGTDGHSSGEQPKFPIPIYRNYKGRRYDAFLLAGWKVQLNGETYSPSKAAGAISHHSENGWTIWRYRDERTGAERLIDSLRG